MSHLATQLQSTHMENSELSVGNETLHGAQVGVGGVSLEKREELKKREELRKREELYRVCNLRQRNIRLLKLDPPCAEENNLLKGTLETVSLDANPVYDALSYPWGPDKDHPTCSMLCSGVKIPITKNCYDALRSLTKNLKLQHTWIDAICINQDDNNEKSQQIPLMRDIYGKARRVLIWLGVKTQRSDEAIRWVKYAARNHGPYSSVKMRSFPGMIWPPEVFKIARLVPEHIGKSAL